MFLNVANLLKDDLDANTLWKKKWCASDVHVPFRLPAHKINTCINLVVCYCMICMYYMYIYNYINIYILYMFVCIHSCVQYIVPYTP